MKDKYGYLAKNTMLFTISSFGSKFLTFFLVPLYTSVLTKAEYGTADLVSTTATLLIYIFTLNIADAVLRFAIDRNKDEISIFSFGIRVLLIGTILLGLCFFVLNNFFSINIKTYIYIYLICVFFSNAFNHILTNYLRAIDKIRQVAIAGIISTLVMISSNILFLLVIKIGIHGYMISMFLGPAFSSIYCLLYIPCTYFIAIFQHEQSNQLHLDMLKYSVPLILNGICWWINNSLDKYFILLYCGNDSNGLYAVAAKIPTIIATIQTIFIQAWNLSAIKEFDKNDSDGFFSTTYRAFNALLIVSCLVLITINKSIGRLLYQGEFYEAWRSASILLLSALFSALAGFVGSIFTAVKNSKIFAVSTVIAAVVNCILNAVLIPIYKVEGAAMATAISFFIIWFVRAICARKYIIIKNNYFRDAVCYCLIILLIILEHSLNSIILVGTFFAIIVIFMYRREAKIIANKIQQRLRKRSLGL